MPLRLVRKMLQHIININEEKGIALTVTLWWYHPTLHPSINTMCKTREGDKIENQIYPFLKNLSFALLKGEISDSILYICLSHVKKKSFYPLHSLLVEWRHYKHCHGMNLPKRKHFYCSTVIEFVEQLATILGISLWIICRKTRIIDHQCEMTRPARQ